MIAEYAPYLFNLGMLDENERDYIQKGSDEAIQFIKEGRYIEANNVSIFMFICKGLSLKSSKLSLYCKETL